MYSAAIREPQVIGPPVAADPWWSCGHMTRWTLTVTRTLDDEVNEHVTALFEASGVTGRVADLLGELAVEYTTELRKLTPCRFVAVTAMIEGTRATISVIAATEPAPTYSAIVPNRGDGYVEPAEGRADLAAGPCLYASVNLLNVRPLP
ncbi:hypothetical protein [Streptomyces pseudovenezuelae]|uniref:hypothetical protein n=1 Tax=Streptomyces pseudovenezuelae TaxID=67350 RepID=UPI0036E1F45B